MPKIEQRPGGYSTRLSLTHPVTKERTVARITARTKRELAEAVAARRVAFLQEARSPAERVTTMTVTEAVEAWVADRELIDASSLAYEGIIRNHITGDALGSMRVADVRVGDIEDWITRKRATHAPRSVQAMIRLVNAGFARLVRRDELTRNPCANIGNAPTAPKGPAKALTTEQVNVLLDGVRGHRYEALVTLGVMLGLRIGEMLALRWDDVDTDAGLLRIERTMTRVRDDRGMYVWVIGDHAKSVYSRRTLNLPLHVQAMLKRQRAGQIDRLGEPGEYVVDRGDGQHYGTPKAPSVGFRALCDTLGLPKWATIHALRHTFASHMIRRGVPITTVARMLGHVGPHITMQVYAHYLRETADEAMALIEGMYGTQSDLRVPSTDTVVEFPRLQAKG